jgi:hypothetical protein
VLASATLDRWDVHALHAGVPVLCGFSIGVPADALPRGTYAARIVVHAGGAWVLVDAFELRVVSARGVRPVDVRPARSAMHRVASAAQRALFLAGGLPAATYASAADPLLYRGDSNDEPVSAVELCDARALASSA